MLSPEFCHVLIDPLLQQLIRRLHLSKGFFVMLPLRLYLLLLHGQLVLQSGHLCFQLNDPPLGLHLTHDQAPVTLLRLFPKPVLLMGNALYCRTSWLVLCPYSECPMKLGSVHIEFTL